MIFALHEIEGFPGASVSEGRGFGSWRMNEGAGAVEHEPSNFHPHERLEIVCEDALAQTVAERIRATAGTGSTSDGIVFIQNVDRVISIGTDH